jgi:hypothetical protein
MCAILSYSFALLQKNQLLTFTFLTFNSRQQTDYKLSTHLQSIFPYSTINNQPYDRILYRTERQENVWQTFLALGPACAGHQFKNYGKARLPAGRSNKES